MEIGSRLTPHLAHRILQARLQGRALPLVSRQAGPRLPWVEGRPRQDHRALHDLRISKASMTYTVRWEPTTHIGTYLGE